MARKEALNTAAEQASASAEMATGLPTPQAVPRWAVIGIFLPLLHRRERVVVGVLSALVFFP